MAVQNNTSLFNQGTQNNDKVATNNQMSEQKDMFTRLLVAQIRNQDPLSPSDPSQFVNQLSQLSQTEALQNLTKTTSASTSLLESLQVLALGAQVGSNVSVATDGVKLDESKVRGVINLGGASAETRLTLTGLDGEEHVITLPAHGAGPLEFTIDPVALKLPPGPYRLQAQASDGTKPQVEVICRLDSVRMSATGGVVLQVEHLGEIDPSAITGFNGKAGAAQVAASTSS
jgi:flagellar basal-body rod modification protein FlgD